jgi:hypothetical protein
MSVWLEGRARVDSLVAALEAFAREHAGVL